MKRKTYILISLIFIFQSFSCKNDSVSPIMENTPGRRDYEWSVDTVKSTMLSLVDIWGSSSNDVWVVGNNGDSEKRLMHYNGNSWNSSGWWSMFAWSIFGFGANDVYMGGYGIWHYDGYKWTKQFEPRLGSMTENGVDITDIRGNNANALWAVGICFKDDVTAYSVIYHNEGQGWHEQMVLNKKNVQFYEIHPTGESNKSLIYGMKIFYTEGGHNLDLDTNVIFEYDGNKSLKEIASAPHYNAQDRKCELYRVQNELFVEMNGKVYEYQQGQYKEFMSAQTLKNGYIMGGRNKSDMFIWQREGLAHYNGTDTQVIFKLKDDTWLRRKAVVFPKEIFFYGFDEKGDYYLIKGKLKD